MHASPVFRWAKRYACMAVVILTLAGCVALIGRNPTYHRVDSVDQSGTNSKMFKLTIPTP